MISRTIRRSIKAGALLGLWLPVLFGCSSLYMDADRNRTRDYEWVVLSTDEIPILRVKCTYIGKRASSVESNLELPVRDVDYYRYEFENLTGLPIQFEEIRSYSKYPAQFTWYRRKKDIPPERVTTEDPTSRDVADYPLWDDNTLKAHESQRLDDVFYYSGLPFNIRFHDITILWSGGTYTFTVYEVFQLPPPTE